MTRRPLIIAAVVTVAALACVVPWWEDVWLFVAYRELRDDDSIRQHGLVFQYIKRAPWIPGKDKITPNQLCVFCQKPTKDGETSHDHCADGWFVRDSQLLSIEFFRPIYSEADETVALCTCPTCHPERER